jgi:nucleoside 2-deoxyribosyltransferase
MIKTGFFAYPSDPSDCGQAIESAIEMINSKNEDVDLKSWKHLQTGGNFIISAILNQIESSDFFCADITGINENVLFELGFAIGKRKPIFLIHDTTITEAFNRYKDSYYLLE